MRTSRAVIRPTGRSSMHCPECRVYMQFDYRDIGEMECPGCGFEFALEQPHRTKVLMFKVREK